jgi:cobalt/nickel transport system permease protein
MHIPDGFLSTGVYLSTGAASAAGVALAVRRAQREAKEANAPLLGVMGAFVFAAQMINFPVAVGATGHLLGGALLAITLGPASAIVVMTAILCVQALVFQDGGVLALTANVFNMAVAGVLAGYLPYRYLAGGRARKLAIFMGGALSVVTCALLALAELHWSGIAMSRPILAVALGLFAVNAALEGILTLGVVQSLRTLNTAWVRKPKAPHRPAMAALALAAVLLAGVGVWFASSAPDGLQRLAEELGIASRAKATMPAPMPGYALHFISNRRLGQTATGLAGVILVFGSVLWIGRRQSRKQR